MTAEALETYLVGGAVRDQLLGLPCRERDWVVVGATIARMLSLGFKQVGRDFPVFLHPQTNEEYALARTERKTGRGHTGFEIHAAPDVTLEQDLRRRDLTINAVAQDVRGNLIDPFNGRADLTRHCLRHVSEAFAEDPLRVLRTARFAARFHSGGFSIAAETMHLMRSISASGELGCLPPERLWIEMEKALATHSPQVFIEVLQQCGALPELFPDWQPSRRDLHNLLASAQSGHSLHIRYACLLAALTPRQITDVSVGLKAPNRYRELAELAGGHCKQCRVSGGAAALALLTTTDAWRRPGRFKDLLEVSKIVAGVSARRCRQLLEGLQAGARIDTGGWQAEGIQGAAMGERVQTQRLSLLNEIYGR